MDDFWFLLFTYFCLKERSNEAEPGIFWKFLAFLWLIIKIIFFLLLLIILITFIFSKI